MEAPIRGFPVFRERKLTRDRRFESVSDRLLLKVALKKAIEYD
jgi:hypothetical protein